jgi:hypothetical protein
VVSFLPGVVFSVKPDHTSAITFWASYVFFNAIFPKLSHDLPEVRAAYEELLSGAISEDVYQHRCSMARSKVMNMSYGWNNIGFTACGALSLAALAGIGANASTAKNNWGYSVSVAVYVFLRCFRLLRDKLL